MLKKMIAYQKLLFSMFLPTMRVNNEKKKTGEILCLILCFFAALLSIVRISSYAGGFSIGGALFVFLYYEWTTKSFLSNLPLNKHFLLSGVIIFSNLVVICSFVVIYGFLYLFVSTGMAILYLLGISQEVISPNAAILQVLLIAVCTSLFYTNAVTSMLLLKREIQRIAGVIAVTAAYCSAVWVVFPYQGGYLLASNSLQKYFQSIPNGWQIAGISVLVTIVFSLVCIFLTEFADWYSRKRGKPPKCPAQ